jgi:hypothetical protein
MCWREQAAVHEAGHAVIAQRFHVPVESATIATTFPDGTSGTDLGNVPFPENATCQYRCLGCIYLAGTSATLRLLGHPRSSASRQRQVSAADLALTRQCYDEHVGQLSPETRDRLFPDVLKIWTKRTTALVRESWDDILDLADRLLVEQTVEFAA